MAIEIFSKCCFSKSLIVYAVQLNKAFSVWGLQTKGFELSFWDNHLLKYVDSLRDYLISKYLLGSSGLYCD